ncbi:mRNA stability protein [Teratosphaeria destructans]|uniref:mRNA stability protein n=1 Tax=Teratosphaeria destructans TaxID=418781 RepID=A0A9W7VXV3_9PEZI|nr:mRNA stability protein [Teratosphaeria destructans]
MALNPHQKNKVDISQLTEEEQKLFRLYGKLPNKKDLLQNKLKERKYFDSGDYAMSKAGKSDAGLVGGLGREHPSPDSIPHLSQQQSQGGPASPALGAGAPIGTPTLHPTASHGQSSSPDPGEIASKIGEQTDDANGEAGEVPIKK